jgi:hypothetical protein
MTTRPHSRVLGGLALLTVLSVMACDESPIVPTPSANLVVQLTDDHTDNVEQVNLYFASVTANSAGGPPETMAVVLANNPQDLLVLRDAVIPLATVEPGYYVSFLINLHEELSNIVEGGKMFPIRIPSEEIKILGGFTVRDNGTTTVTLDFDAEQSLIRLGNGEWLLKPVVGMEVSGSRRPVSHDVEDPSWAVVDLRRRTKITRILVVFEVPEHGDVPKPRRGKRIANLGW